MNKFQFTPELRFPVVVNGFADNISALSRSLCATPLSRLTHSLRQTMHGLDTLDLFKVWELKVPQSGLSDQIKPS